MMQALAKRGFAQSYTYFSWRNTKAELEEYQTELTHTTLYFRPNFFANTSDVLPPILQHGGRPAFKSRLVLAATLKMRSSISCTSRPSPTATATASPNRGASG